MSDFNQAEQAILDDAANVVAALARQIKSPNLDLDGIKLVAQSLEHAANGLRSIRKSALIRQS